MTTLAPEPTVTDPASTDGLDHIVCCDDDVALCGLNVADHEWGTGDPQPTCVVCRELQGKPCRICGH